MLVVVVAVAVAVVVVVLLAVVMKICWSLMLVFIFFDFMRPWKTRFALSDPVSSLFGCKRSNDLDPRTEQLLWHRLENDPIAITFAAEQCFFRSFL
jgi:hypothetical protein